MASHFVSRLYCVLGAALRRHAGVDSFEPAGEATDSKGDGGVTSIVLSKQHSCAFRRMEFHSPAREQPAMPPPSPPPVVPRPTR